MTITFLYPASGLLESQTVVSALEYPKAIAIKTNNRRNARTIKPPGNTSELRNNNTTMLLANSADNKLIIFFLYFLETRKDLTLHANRLLGTISKKSLVKIRKIFKIFTQHAKY